MAALHLSASSSDDVGDSSQQIHEKTTPCAQSVALGMAIAWRNGSVVIGVACGSTKGVQT